MTADSVWLPYLQSPHLPPATCPCSFQSCAESPNRITAVPYLETSSGSPLSLQHSASYRGHKRPSVTWPYPFSPASSLHAPSILVPHTRGIPKSLGSPIFPLQLPCLRTLKMARLLPGMPFASLVAWNAFCLQNSTLVAVSFSRQPPGELFCDCPSHTVLQVSACLPEDRKRSFVLGVLELNEWSHTWHILHILQSDVYCVLSTNWALSVLLAWSWSHLILVSPCDLGGPWPWMRKKNHVFLCINSNWCPAFPSVPDRRQPSTVALAGLGMLLSM